MIYWFTGQPGSGKTTLANYLYNHLRDSQIICIDGDQLRYIFNNKDYSENGRRENIKRAQDIALFLYKSGYEVIVSLVSPYKDQRDEFKKITNVIEIYVHTTDDRGKSKFHVENYQPPTEDFIDIDTTNTEETKSFNELRKELSFRNIYM